MNAQNNKPRRPFGTRQNIFKENKTHHVAVGPGDRKVKRTDIQYRVQNVRIDPAKEKTVSQNDDVQIAGVQCPFILNFHSSEKDNVGTNFIRNQRYHRLEDDHQDRKNSQPPQEVLKTGSKQTVPLPGSRKPSGHNKGRHKRLPGAPDDTEG